MEPRPDRAAGAAVTRPTDADRRVLSAAEVDQEDLADWRLLVHSLHGRFLPPDYATGLALVQAVGAAAEAHDHHPDLTLAWGRVDLRLTSHDVRGVTQRDVRLARAVSAAARELGAAADPSAVTTLELALDTPDHDEVKPFWAAVLGYVEGRSADEVDDPAGARPTLWFQPCERDRAVPAQRFHLDVWVPVEVAEQRVRDAVAAGGTLVSDEAAPAFWVLADAQGNKACICTVAGRGGP